MLKKMSLLMVCLLVLSIGCAKRKQIITRVGLEQKGEFILGERINLVNCKESRIGDILYLKLRFVNLMPRRASIQLRVQFFDGDGDLMKDPWGWQTVVIEGGEILTREVVAPLKGAVDYNILIQGD